MIILFANDFGLKKGTSAPYFLAIEAIFLLSVETTILSKISDFFNILIVWAMIGLPLNFLKFLPTILVLPPRAGITAKIFFFALFEIY